MEPLSIKLGVKDPERPVPQLIFERLKGRVVAALVDGEATLKELQVVTLGKPDGSDFHSEERRPTLPLVVLGQSIALCDQRNNRCTRNAAMERMRAMGKEGLEGI